MGQGFISKYILRGIADFIRGRKNTTAEIKPVDMVAELESIPTYEQGKQAEYDRFWDSYQDYGNRFDYTNAFSGHGWNGKTFKPKYDMSPTNGYMMFRYNDYDGDMVVLFNNLGIALDTSMCTNINYMFFGSLCTRFGELNFSKVSGTGDCLAYCNYLKTIDKIIVGDKTAFSASSFHSDANLENVMFEGTLGKNGLNLQWSTKLSHDSLMSIINCLQDKSADTSGTAWVVTIGSENYAKLTDEEIALAEQKGWSLA